MEKFRKILFLIVGILTVLEFLFVRGMFTWLIACGLTLAVGLWNIIAEMTNKKYLIALHYLLTVIALLMGYYVVGM